MAIAVEGYGGLEEVARGGFGIVYRAEQSRVGRVVALKVLASLHLDARALDRFDRECRAMGALSWHPNIVVVHDSGTTTDGHAYLAMEFVDGGSLADRVERTGPVPWPEATALAVQVASALQAAHDAGHVHRDIKPENVLVGLFGEAKLTDFGIATVTGGRRTTTGVSAFTVAHAAPEVLEGTRATSASDVYSLGSTLHHLLAGQPPFFLEGEELLVPAILRALNDPPPDLRESGVSDDLAVVIEAAMAKDPADRPASAADLGRSLQAMQRDHGQPVTELVVDPRGGAVAAAPAEAPEPPATLDESRGDPRETVVVRPRVAPPDPAGRGRPRWLVPVAAAVVLALVAGLVAFLASGDGTEEVTPAGEVVATIAVDAPPGALADVAVGAGAVWVVNGDSSISRIDPEANEVTTTTEVGPSVSGVAAGLGAAWVPVAEGVVRLNAANGNDFEKADLFGASPQGVAIGEELVWVGDEVASTVSGIDPETFEVDPVVDLEEAPMDLAIDESTVWALSDAGTVAQVDIDDQAVSSVLEVGESGVDIAVDSTRLWVLGEEEDLVRIDLSTGEVAERIDLGLEGKALAIAVDGTVWVAGGEDQLLRVDPSKNEVTGSLTVGRSPVGVATGEGSVWVSNADDATVTRVDPT